MMMASAMSEWVEIDLKRGHSTERMLSELLRLMLVRREGET